MRTARPEFLLPCTWRTFRYPLDRTRSPDSPVATDGNSSFPEFISGRYRVERELGGGGMATVLLAVDEHFARLVAIKVLGIHVRSGTELARFQREIDLVSTLQHPNVVPIFDSGVLDERPFFVMPFVEGESLRHRFAREGELPLDDVVTITTDIAAALDHAHARGVLHRDVKPENVLLSEGRAMLADFGVALEIADPTSRLTGTGMVMGTPGYMSPEQSSGNRTLDARSDVYALGCLVYEALAGHPVFSGYAHEVIARHLIDQPPGLYAVRPDMPSAVERVVFSALAKSPADRPASAGLFAERLAAAARDKSGVTSGEVARGGSGGVAATRAASGETAQASFWSRSRTRVLAAAAAATVVVAAIVAYVASQRSGSFEARDRLVVSALQLEPADRVLSEALRNALIVALEQSAHVNVVHGEEVQTTTRAMRIADSTVIDPTIARDVAVRLGAKAVLIPTVKKAAEGWLVELAAQVPTSNRPLAVERATASGQDDLVETLGKLAARLRRSLGEPLREGETGVQLAFATTASLEALRSWSEGRRHFSNGQYNAAELAYREAVQRDTLFAMAWKSLGVTYYWLNEKPRGDSAFDRALHLANRLTDRERLMIEADVANWRDQGPRAALLFRRVLERYPDDREARGMLAYALMRDQDYDASATEYATIVKADSMDFGSHINYATVLAAMGRQDSALAHYRRAFTIDPATLLSGQPLVQEYVLNLAEAGEMDSARAVVARAETGNALSKTLALRLRGLLYVRTGRADSAVQAFREALLRSGDVGRATIVRNAVMLSRVLVWAGRNAEARQVLREVRTVGLDPNLFATWPRRLALAAWDAGDAALARDFAAQVRKASTAASVEDRTDLHLVEGAAALASGNAAMATMHADSIAGRSQHPEVGMLRGRAYEAAKRYADAEREYVAASELKRCCTENYFDVTESSFAAARLALARGDTTAARARLSRLMNEWAFGDGGFVAHKWARTVGTSTTAR